MISLFMLFEITIWNDDDDDDVGGTIDRDDGNVDVLK